MRAFRCNLTKTYIRSGRWKQTVSFLLLTCALVLPACGENQLPPEPEEGVLIYAALNPVSSDIEGSVARFNERHQDVQIEIHDYSDEGGVDRLLTELVLGRVPDIMEMHYYGKGGPTAAAKGTSNFFVVPGDYEGPEDEYWMPYRQMTQKGYLEDLWPYIDSDPVLGRDGVVESILETIEVNGSLPMLFGNAVIFTLSGRESVVGDRYSWTLDDVMEAYAAMPEGSTILRYNMTKREIFYNLLCNSLERYVDRETGACSFDSQEFRDLVGFLEEFPDEVDAERAQEAEEEVKANIAHGRQMLEGMMVLWPQDMGFADSLWGERAAFPGYPTADGSSGSFFYPAGTILAMSSACQNKEAAWDYIRTLVTPRVIGGKMPNGKLSIPINRSNYEKNMLKDLEQVELNYGLFGDFAFQMYALKHFKYGEREVFLTRLLTEEDIQRVNDLVEHTTQLYWPEDELSDIVWDTLGSYFAGDRTLDDTIGLLQNRVGLYLNEQK